MTLRLTTILLTIAVLPVGCIKKAEPSNPLLGSWSIETIQWISNDTTVIRNPKQNGLLLVTPNRYSICWSPLETKRNPFQNLSAPTDEEVLEGFKTIVFNTGSYELSNSIFSTKPHMAKVPGFEGGKQFFDYEISDNEMTLILFDETYPDGKKPSWFGKWRTKFSLTKLED
ncbi:lipocalin-like domain-containing protein [Flagellimonas sp. CMM7]|uniref:lipocalin-like domain-containing protein n=1 Tax=Flagellimonas sp. CMM7 TaxID=2654676 RepID=UPI0013D7E863|nr:lipocalin-like domain-containing protein [Flagellimonas sp. CMM7]UII80239.1 lipocalin-like domain-containing protein [Flagellimonas sp. CMM7]